MDVQSPLFKTLGHPGLYQIRADQLPGCNFFGRAVSQREVESRTVSRDASNLRPRDPEPSPPGKSGLKGILIGPQKESPGKARLNQSEKDEKERRDEVEYYEGHMVGAASLRVGLDPQKESRNDLDPANVIVDRLAEKRGLFAPELPANEYNQNQGDEELNCSPHRMMPS